MSKKLMIDRTDRKDNQVDIVFRLADAIDVSDKDALYLAAEDLIVQHAHKEYPGPDDKRYFSLGRYRPQRSCVRTGLC